MSDIDPFLPMLESSQQFYDWVRSPAGIIWLSVIGGVLLVVIIISCLCCGGCLTWKQVCCCCCAKKDSQSVETQEQTTSVVPVQQHDRATSQRLDMAESAPISNSAVPLPSVTTPPSFDIECMVKST
ncbi:MAG: uncharacterized protein KVP18_003966 [Porospora cf. gigantea A]|uniref:uncharacterized protein n=1 Tax=Porospora cf. gigantea A TaxID=2853593 RepID=UPI003559C81D|nr:MAG: hypothetical protein KVP18_003966 [Porospora cf. gigantea A]